MALSFKEKNQLKKQVGSYLKQLDTADLSRKERNGIKKEIGLALKKLDESINLAAGGNPELDRLVAGEFNHLPPEEFLQKLKEITDSLGGDIEPIKPPTVAYIEKRLGEAVVLESVAGPKNISDTESCD